MAVAEFNFRLSEQRRKRGREGVLPRGSVPGHRSAKALRQARTSHVSKEASVA